jgi:hypothetical protein
MNVFFFFLLFSKGFTATYSVGLILHLYKLTKKALRTSNHGFFLFFSFLKNIFQKELEKLFTLVDLSEYKYILNLVFFYGYTKRMLFLVSKLFTNNLLDLLKLPNSTSLFFFKPRVSFTALKLKKKKSIKKSYKRQIIRIEQRQF